MNISEKAALQGKSLWALASLFYLFQFVLRSSPNAMAPYLMDTFSMSAVSLGLFSACFYYAYLSMQIPIGLVLDHIGPGRVLFLSSITCSLGLGLFYFSWNIPSALAARFFLGLGASGGLLSAIASAGLGFSENNKGFAVAVTIALGNLGGLLGNIFLSTALEVVSWRSAVLFLFVCALLMTAAAFFVRKNLKSKTLPPFSTKNIRTELSVILNNPFVWLVALISLLSYMHFSLLTDTWGLTFLSKMYGTTPKSASYSLVFLFIGLAVGAPCSAWISGKLKSYKKLLIMLPGLCFCTTLLFIWVPFPPIMKEILVFFLGFCAATQALVFPAVMGLIPPKFSGLASGFVNMMIMCGGALFHPLMGFLLDFFSTSETACPAYSLAAYQKALLCLPLAAATAFVLAWFLPETFRKKT